MTNDDTMLTTNIELNFEGVEYDAFVNIDIRDLGDTYTIEGYNLFDVEVFDSDWNVSYVQNLDGLPKAFYEALDRLVIEAVADEIMEDY